MTVLTRTMIIPEEIMDDYGKQIDESIKRSRKLIKELRPGMFSDPDDASKQMPLSEVAEHAITSFTNIVQQMSSDDEIPGPTESKEATYS